MEFINPYYVEEIQPFFDGAKSIVLSKLQNELKTQKIITDKDIIKIVEEEEKDNLKFKDDFGKVKVKLSKDGKLSGLFDGSIDQIIQDVKGAI